MYNNDYLLYSKHMKDLFKSIKQIDPVFNNSTMNHIIKLRQQLTGMNNPMAKDIIKRQQQMSINNPIIKQTRKLQSQFNNIFHNRTLNQILKNQRQIRRVTPSFNASLNNMRNIGVIPNFYKMNSLRKLKSITPYFDYIKSNRSEINKLSQINYSPLKSNYLSTQSVIGIPGDDFTQDEMTRNKSINHKIDLSNDKIDKIINKVADEAATKATLKISKKFDNQKASKKDNDVERYKYMTLNYNSLSTHNWWYYIGVIIYFMNNVDQTCHTLDDVIMLINNHSPEILHALQIAMLWLNGMGL